MLTESTLLRIFLICNILEYVNKCNDQHLLWEIMDVNIVIVKRYTIIAVLVSFANLFFCYYWRIIITS